MSLDNLHLVRCTCSNWTPNLTCKRSTAEFTRGEAERFHLPFQGCVVQYYLILLLLSGGHSLCPHVQNSTCFLPKITSQFSLTYCSSELFWVSKGCLPTKNFIGSKRPTAERNLFMNCAISESSISKRWNVYIFTFQLISVKMGNDLVEEGWFQLT